MPGPFLRSTNGQLVAPLQGGTGASEEARGRGVGLVQLDVAAAVGARCAWGRRAQVVGKALRGGVVDDQAELPQPDIKLVVDARLPCVPRLKDEVDTTDRVRAGRPAHLTRPGQL